MIELLYFLQVEQSTVAIKETFRKFDDVFEPCFHVVPWVLGMKVAGHLSLRVQQLDVRCETKTKFMSIRPYKLQVYNKMTQLAFLGESNNCMGYATKGCIFYTEALDYCCSEGRPLYHDLTAYRVPFDEHLLDGRLIVQTSSTKTSLFPLWNYLSFQEWTQQMRDMLDA